MQYCTVPDGNYYAYIRSITPTLGLRVQINISHCIVPVLYPGLGNHGVLCGTVPGSRTVEE